MTRWTSAAGRGMRRLLTTWTYFDSSTSAYRPDKVMGPNGAQGFAAVLIGRVGQHSQMPAAASRTKLGGHEQTTARRGGMGSGGVNDRVGGNTSRSRGKAIQWQTGCAQIGQPRIGRTLAHRVR